MNRKRLGRVCAVFHKLLHFGKKRPLIATSTTLLFGEVEQLAVYQFSPDLAL